MFVQRVEVSVTVLLPLHTGFQKEVFSDEIQILIAGFEPGICEEIMKKTKSVGLWDCSGTEHRDDG